MNRNYIKFSSVTHAMRAKEIIEKNGKKVIIKKNTKYSNADSCGYVLIFNGDSEKILNLLKINQIKYIGYGYQ